MQPRTRMGCGNTKFKEIEYQSMQGLQQLVLHLVEICQLLVWCYIFGQGHYAGHVTTSS